MKKYLSLTVVHVLWGLSFLGSRIALSGGLQTWSLMLVRHVIASAVMLMLLALTGQLRLKKTQLLPTFLSGIIGITVYYWLELLGIQHTSTSQASLILAAIPILTLAAQATMERRRLTAAELIGVLLSLAGVSLIVLGGAQEGSGSLLGDALILGAAATWVAYLFLSRRLRQELSSLQMTGWQTIFGLFTIIPFAIAEKTDWTTVSGEAWCSAILLGLLCSALCYWLYGNSLTDVSPIAVAIFVNLMPVTTVIGGVLFLQETLTWHSILGGSLVVSSIFLVNLPAKR